MRTRLVTTLVSTLFLLQGCPGRTDTPDATDGGTDASADVPYVEPVLAPPPPGRGIQLRVEFDVPAGTEQQRCWFFHLPSTTDLEVTHYEVAYNLGSHHMNLFRMLPSVAALPTTTLPADTGTTGDGVECFNAVDFNSWDLVVGSQTEQLNWQLPAGVAYRLHANSPMLMQSHFVNGLTQNTPGNHAVVLVNLWTAEDPSTITQHLGTMFANNRSINLPPHQESEFTARCTLPAGGTFVAMTGHFHSRGRQFSVSSSMDGTTPIGQVYQSLAWSEPPFELLPTALVVPNNGGLIYTCQYQNDTDFPITFGPHVEYEEHCNLFAYYYPSDPDSHARYCF